MRALCDRLLVKALHQWEQVAWNEVIQPFLWGMGEEGEPLKYRILPHTSYGNVFVVEARAKDNLPTDMVIIHAGGLHGKEKVRINGSV